MKKATIMAFLLVALAPMMQVWAGGTANHYARLTANISKDSPSGSGLVYVGTSTTTTAGSFGATSQEKQGGQNCNGTQYAFNLFARAELGYEFVGWSETDGGAIIANSAVSPWTAPAIVAPEGSAPNSGSKDYYKDVTYYANFVALPPATVTFAAPNNGSYTVNGETISSQVVKADQPVPYSVTLVATPAANFRFAGWYVLENNSKSFFSTDATTTKKFDSDATVGAEFIPDGYTIYAAAAGKGYDNLATALGEAQSGESISIYDDITLDSAAVIAKGVTLTVSAGKTLTVNGSLAVAGTLSINGTLSGSGKVYKISYLINQGDVITITNLVTGEECGIIHETYFNFIPRYRKTTVEANSPSISGTIDCLHSWGVLLNGSNAYAITSQNPTALKVTMNKTSAINEIESIGTEVSSITTTDNYLLLANCSLTGPKASNGRLNFQGVVDCAGKTLTASGAAYDSNFYSTYLNGNVVFEGSYNNYFQNGKAAIFNCSSVAVAGCKNGTNLFYLYDCGTAASPATLSFTYYPDSGRSLRDTCSNTNYRKLYIYSGYYDYTFNATNDGTSRCQVYGGAFTSDPTNYRANKDVLYVDPETMGDRDYNVVKTVTESAEVTMMIGDAEYETLEKAIFAAKSGDTIVCVATVDLDAEIVEIPQGLNVTIDMDGYTIQNGKIVNNGSLVITDSTTGNGGSVTDASGGTVACDIDNSGTLQLIFGTYTGSIDNKDNTLTAYNGMFSGVITKSGGAVDLRGGHFSENTFTSDTLTNLGVSEGHIIVRAKAGWYSICKIPNGTMVSTSATSFTITPYSLSNPNDFSLLLSRVKDNVSARNSYSAEEWSRLAELMPFYQAFNDKVIDATLVVDREVGAGTLGFSGSLSNYSYPLSVGTMASGSTNRLLSAAMVATGWTAMAYKYFFTHQLGPFQTLGFSVNNTSSVNNGTVCDVWIELWDSVRATDYTPTNQHMITNSVFIVGAKRFTIGAGSDVAMIRPATGAATFYSTLAAAVDTVAVGGTVMLANDCADNVTVGKACTIDTNGFAFTGEITLGEGYSVSFSDGKYVISMPDPADVLVEKVEVATIVEQVVSAEWLAANDVSTDNKTDEEIQAAVQEVLKQTDDNGNAKWENLVIGQKADEKAAVTAANGGTDKTATIEVSFEVPKDESTGEKIETGYTVKYAFDQVDTAGDVVENGAGEAKDEPTLDFASVETDTPTYFKMRAVLESNDDPDVKSEVEVEKTIGVLKVDSDAEYTILAVPWQSLGSGDIKASELVHAASLSEDDELIVYNDDGSTTSWVVKNGEWTSPTEYTIGDGPAQQNETVDPSTKEIARGQGVWLKRSDTTKDIVLIGQPATDDEPVETPIAAATSEDEPTWNLVASPKMEDVDLQTAFTEEKGNTGDEIIVPTAGTPKHYTYKDNKWGYSGVISTTTVRLPDGTSTQAVKFGHVTNDTKVPAGQGFWYLNKDSSNNEKKITW